MAVSALRRLSCLMLCLLPLLSAAASTAPRKTGAVVEQALFAKSFREVIDRGVANGAYRGVAIGVIDGKRRQTIYLGHRDGGKSAPPDDDSRFEIGAVSEIFAGLLLAQAAVDRTVRLHDPLGGLLAPGFPFADPALAKASLESLATQRAGLPSRPANLFPANLADPYADYATEDLFACLALEGSVDLTTPAPDYSVLNIGLLGTLLGRAYATPYADVLSTRVLAPLGMAHTGFGDERLLTGHARGDVAPHWHYGVLGAAAGLRASLPDLLAFLQYNLTPEQSPLRPALLLARQPRADGASDALGFGWKVREVASDGATWPLVWRASDTAGFSSFIGFRTDKQRGIVLLGNAAEDLSELGMAWLAEGTAPAAPHGYNAPAAPKLDSYPGLYTLISGDDLIVRAAEDSLHVQLPGAWPQRLRVVDRDVFAADGGALALTFMRSADDINGVVLRLGDQNISGMRRSLRAPRMPRARIATSASLLAQYAGDYRVAPESWMRLSVDGEGLTAQLSLGERLALYSYAVDRFSDAQGVLELVGHRDEHGRIDKLELDLAGGHRDAIPLRIERTSPGASP